MAWNKIAELFLKDLSAGKQVYEVWVAETALDAGFRQVSSGGSTAGSSVRASGERTAHF